MKVFVTGGAGYIGSHITLELLEAGHDVTVYDDLSLGFKDNVDNRAQFIEGSTLDKDCLKKSLKNPLKKLLKIIQKRWICIKLMLY